MKKIIFIFSLLRVATIFPHGESSLGPHKGHIQMPGAFHTELVVIDSKNIEVYLLDINFKNPMIVKSSVTLILEGIGKKISVECSIDTKKVGFICPISVDLGNYKKIILKTVRKGVNASESAEYNLPIDGDAKVKMIHK
jgi:hypothetical protein